MFGVGTELEVLKTDNGSGICCSVLLVGSEIARTIASIRKIRTEVLTVNQRFRSRMTGPEIVAVTLREATSFRAHAEMASGRGHGISARSKSP